MPSSGIFRLLLFLLLVPVIGISQETIVRGKVTNASNGDPIPFANIVFAGTTAGTTTDFDGLFEVTTRMPVDSLVASYIGYIRKIKPVRRGENQVINFQLEEDLVELQEVVVYAGENPAFPIIRNVVRNRDRNNKKSLDAYEYESYTKTQINIDNMSEKFRSRSIVRKVRSVIDSVEIIAGEDGQPVMPIFISEAISRFYFKSNPKQQHENMIKTKVSGVGITDGTLTSQVIGSSFQEYNFYQNWLNIVEKEFISPIADGWRIYYEYDLIDSLWIGDHYCYRLDLFPKRSQDLAFRGTIWVTKDEWALKQVDLTVDKTANLNFIEKIKVQQELEPSDAGPWLPVKTRVLIDIGEVTPESAGVLAKFYVSNKDFVVNQPKDNSFYNVLITMEEDVREQSEEYWAEHRHDSLSTTEVNVYQMIDTLKRIPAIYNITELTKALSTGYFKAGKFDIGPYPLFFANNNVEGIRLSYGMRTNINFSDKIELSGLIGYGFDDKRWKYSAGIKYIASRKPWTTFYLERSRDVNPVWVLTDDVDNRSIFFAYSRFGELSDPFLQTSNIFRFQTQLATGLTQKLEVRTDNFDPQFGFRYRNNSDIVDSAAISTTEVSIETRFARDELVVINDNDRISLGTLRWPEITVRYTYGLKDVLGGDFEYHKIAANISKRQKLGILGTSSFSLSGGYIFNDLPYPLLKAHVGNETPFYIGFAYNLMDFFEFASDHYASLRYRHQFEGLMLNKIPLMRKLKWRLVGNANVLVGGMRSENLRLATDDNQQIPFRVLGDTPYVELGYGLENIFRFFRIDAFHRMTYTGQPGTDKFRVKFSLQVIL